MQGNSLTLSELVAGREDAPLTKPLSITLAAGEILAVRGRNGSGKSTLLKTIAGLLPPLSGAITLNFPQGQESLTYIGHKLGLIKEMSVYDNVALWAKLHRVPELVAAAMHYFDLTDIADVPVSKLSAGWQKRVALTRLITIPSTLWLLDEPTAHLDADGISLLNSLLDVRAQQGGIIIAATHGVFHSESIKTIIIN